MKAKQLKLHLEIVQILAADLDCQIEWWVDMDCPGMYNVVNKKVILNPLIIGDERDLWSTVFHELEHVKADKKGIWKYYHNCPKNDQKIRRQRLKVERYIDKKAAETMAIYFPELEFLKSY